MIDRAYEISTICPVLILGIPFNPNIYMKLSHFFSIISVCCIIPQTICAQETYELSGKKLKDYTIVYSTEADIEEGATPALNLRDKLKKATNITIPIEKSGAKKKNIISISKSDTISTFNYAIDVRSGNIRIDGGCGWAMNQAIDILVDKLAEDKQLSAMHLNGTIEGKILFPRPDGVNLRIFDDNVWDYHQDTIPPKWQEAGLDCRDSVRSPKFAQLIRAYMPDVICLQEYSSHMDSVLYPMLKKYGYKRASNGKEESWPHTPIFYDKAQWKPLRINYRLYGHGPDTWCNNGSKSFTSAVLKNKATGKIVGVVSTHLWFRGDKSHPGSTYARASQVALIMAEVEVIKAKFNCPVFVCGDMNSTEDTLPMQLFINSGYKPCYKIATQYSDKALGHHTCFAHTVGSRNNNGKDREAGSIDHCFIHNEQNTEVKVFDCIRPYFSVFLTDHYPNLIDVELK